MIHPYDVVEALEEKIAEYAGSKYAVAVDSCTNALLIALKLRFMQGACKEVNLPKRTYVGVGYAVLNAGGFCTFRDEMWKGAYELKGVDIIDSARRFRRRMYKGNEGKLYCLSAHWGKHLKIGRGGFILTDNPHEVSVLKIMRFDGRTAKVPPKEDSFEWPGYHCYMLPEEAARGLMLMASMPDDNPDIPWDDYASLDEYDIFKRPAR